jgi:hypothetical protein
VTHPHRFAVQSHALCGISDRPLVAEPTRCGALRGPLERAPNSELSNNKPPRQKSRPTEDSSSSADRHYGFAHKIKLAHNPLRQQLLAASWDRGEACICGQSLAIMIQMFSIRKRRIGPRGISAKYKVRRTDVGGQSTAVSRFACEPERAGAGGSRPKAACRQGQRPVPNQSVPTAQDSPRSA